MQIDFQSVWVGKKDLIRRVKCILFNLYFQRMKDLMKYMVALIYNIVLYVLWTKENPE
jgi:hypothetical protein